MPTKNAAQIFSDGCEGFGSKSGRVQIIKGWLDRSGNLNEKVYDVGGLGIGKLLKHWEAPAVGNTVDIKLLPIKTRSAPKCYSVDGPRF